MSDEKLTGEGCITDERLGYLLGIFERKRWDLFQYADVQVSTEIALAELRAHRQAALSGEDRRILGTLLVLLPGWLTHGEPRLSTPEQRAALSVLTRLVEAKP